MTAPPPAGTAPSEAPLLQLEDFLPHRLNVLSSLVSQALTRVYGRYGIGIPEWRVLVTLGEYGVMTGKAVGAQTHMHKTKVSRAVAQLEQRKFLTRRANRADLREVVPVADAGRPRGLRGACPERARIHGPARRSGRSRRPRRLRPRDEAADRALGRARRRGRNDGKIRDRAGLRCRRSTAILQGEAREALHLFPLVRRLSGSHRAQSQGPDHRGRSRSICRRKAACNTQAGIPRRQSADAGAGAAARFRRRADPVARDHRISRRDPSAAAAAAARSDRAREGAGAGAGDRLRHPSAQQSRARCAISRTCSARSRPRSTPGITTGSPRASRRSRR